MIRQGLYSIKKFILDLYRYPAIHLEACDYDQYWKDKRKNELGSTNVYQRIRAEWIIKRIDEDATVLDVGCGDGGVLLHMLKHKSFKATGADTSQYALDFLNSQGVNTILLDLEEADSASQLPESDYVLLLEVLEHIQSPEHFLKKIEGKAHKAIFFSFPNTGYLRYRLRLLFGSFPLQWRLHPGEHLRFWTYRDLHWWLRELGYLDRSEIHVYRGIPVLNRIWKGLFGEAFIVKIAV